MTVLLRAFLNPLLLGRVKAKSAPTLPQAGGQSNTLDPVRARILIIQMKDEGYDARVLEHFSDTSGRLIAIPAQRKKRLAVLRWLVEEFQPGRRYPEAEVNRIISRRHPDFATLRRYMVDEELIQRRNGVYWRAGTLPNLGHDPGSWPAL